MDLQVLPLSLDQYWDAYVGNEAPYYIQAIMRDPEDIVLEVRDWGEPSPGFETVNGRTVLKEKYLSRKLRVRQAFAPKYCNYYVVFSLLERNDTHITIFET